MTTSFENPKTTESSESFDQSGSNRLSDQLNTDLYRDMSVFQNKSSAQLPGIEIAGLPETTGIAVRAAESNKGSRESSQPKANPEGNTPESRDASIKAGGMMRVPSEDSGDMDVYKPANGATDKQGRNKVELIHQGDRLLYENSQFPDGRQVQKEFDAKGEVISTRHSTPDGKRTTIYPGVSSNADIMHSALKQEGAAGLIREIDSVIKQDPVGGWTKVEKMLSELKERGVQLYDDNGATKLNDAWPGFTDSTIIANPQEPAPTPAPETKAPGQEAGGPAPLHRLINALQNSAGK